MLTNGMFQVPLGHAGGITKNVSFRTTHQFLFGFIIFNATTFLC